ncbi:hypothetical protein PRIPAC_82030 [Pristionchus pacificus]|uniref:G protein-coupled receptor n=1 Tax=Pristionchus pacificus TaxID=54126 RepID=A0A2A6BI10_PRIPA|nr:hypothetical protein PRIPAC_82030 [Pristionchus pacificus]|eukprot:PDM65466.1 G protein-coupled receptor [Pristionchus pacificus]
MDLWQFYEAMNVCEVSEELAHSAVLKIIIAVKTGLCVVGLTLISLLLNKKGLSWLAHPHTQCMFGVHIFSTYMATIFYLCCFVTDLIRFTMPGNEDCAYALPFWFAFTSRLLAVTGTFGQLFSMAAIAVERLYASLRPVSYESLDSALIKAGSTALVMSLSFGMVFGLCVPGVKWVDVAASFTIRTVENQERFQTLVNVEVLLELFVLLTFHFSLYLNFRKKISETNYVAARYQISSNKKIIVLLLPIFWTHFCCIFITSFGLVIYPYVTPTDTPINHGIFLESVALAPLYAVTMPFIMFFSLRDKRPGRSHLDLGGDDHFRTLDTLFERKEEETGMTRVVNEAVRGLEVMFCCKV